MLLHGLCVLSRSRRRPLARDKNPESGEGQQYPILGGARGAYKKNTMSTPNILAINCWGCVSCCRPLRR